MEDMGPISIFYCPRKIGTRKNERKKKKTPFQS